MAVYRFRTPISEEEVRKLHVNDTLYITGIVVTARDAAHRRALEFYKDGKKLPVDLEGLTLFHCGPIVKQEGDRWRVVAAGPTTSSRMDMFEDEIIKNFRVRVVVGKGGMSNKTAHAMQLYGAVYGALTGGAAVLVAKTIKRVKSVEWSDLGMPEALWILEVKDFGPLTVVIDAHGNNLFHEIQTKANEEKRKIYKKLGL